MKLFALPLVLLCACRVVAGTDDLFLCGPDDKPCPEGGGDAGGGSAGGNSAGGGSPTCTDGTFAVEITVIGPIVVTVESTGAELTAGTHDLCLAAGNDRMRAECGNSQAAVSWDNGQCSDVDDKCDFTLTKDETFVVNGASACE
jgi:hypothetical protein